MSTFLRGSADGRYRGPDPDPDACECMWCSECVYEEEEEDGERLATHMPCMGSTWTITPWYLCIDNEKEEEEEETHTQRV